VLGYIRKHDLLRAGDRVGIAVSGGADSLALLRILLELRQEIGIVLSVVHLNHKLRGAESDTDEQFVRELAAGHGLEFVCESCEVKVYAAERKLSLETAARELRYEFFEKSLSTNSLNKIATAHTLDDQAETVLLKIARGAGTRGLAGIYPRRGVKHDALAQANHSIIRPLLGTRRAELEVYLMEVGQKWREDSSNRDLRHTRNRIRHGILPRLERHVNPSVRESLSEAADIARGEEEYWAGEVASLLPQVWTGTRRGGTITGKGFEQLGLAFQRRLVRAVGESLELELEFKQVEKVLGLKEGGCSMLPGNWTVSRCKGDLRFEPASAEPGDYSYELPVPGRVEIAEAGVAIESAVMIGDSGLERYSPEHLLGAKLVQNGMVVRNWRAGERFWPTHTKEPKKIKELLQDRHITGDEKKSWPVVASGDEVVWVRGFGVRRDFQASDNKGVLIRDFPISEGEP